MSGITTRAQPGEAVFLTDAGSGRCAQIGAFDPRLPGPENRMQPCLPGFLSLGVPLLQQYGKSDGTWVFIDEIGYLETACPEYCRAILDLMKRRRLAAAVRKQDLPFLQALCRRADAFVVDLDAPYGRAGCVIMASGLGRRFGGDKLMAAFAGRPLIQYALDATAGVFVGRVAVTRSKAVAELCERQGVPVVLHDQPHRSDTVRLGLCALLAQAGECGLTGCLFCPADQPLLQRQTVAALALCAAQDPEAIWRPACGAQQGAPVFFPAWAFPELLALPHGRGGGAVVRKYPQRVRCLPVQEAQELADVDTRAGLAALEKAKKEDF